MDILAPLWRKNVGWDAGGVLVPIKVDLLVTLIIGQPQFLNLICN